MNLKFISVITATISAFSVMTAIPENVRGYEDESTYEEYVEDTVSGYDETDEDISITETEPVTEENPEITVTTVTTTSPEEITEVTTVTTVEEYSDSETAARGFVSRLYTVVLGRDPDSTGLEKWVKQLKDGEKTSAEIVYGFVFSPEYTSKGTTDEEYIDMLYRTLFDRDPDTTGFENWCGKAEIFSRKYILDGFIRSTEFSKLCNRYGFERGSITLSENRDKNTGVTNFMANLYQQCLGRNPDVQGLNNWTGIILRKEKSLTEVIIDFTNSTEFRRTNELNEDYVSSLYRGILGREPDESGLSNWVYQLDTGKSRFAVFLGMMKSTEFRRMCSKYGMESYITDLSNVYATVQAKYTCYVYQSDSTQSNILGTLYSGQILNVTGIKGNYLRVSFNNVTGCIPVSSVRGYEGTGIKVLSVVNIPQNSTVGGQALPTGCEVSSLSVLLKYLGFSDAGKNFLADNFMPTGNIGYTDPNYAFIGTPSSSYSYGAYAGVMVSTARNYLNYAGADEYTVSNITGYSIDDLFDEIDKGNPVLIWYTMNCTSKRTYGATWYLSRGTPYTEAGTGTYSFTWKQSEHCSVLAGYNKTKGTVILADVWANSGASTGGLTEYSISAFESAYEFMGRQAVIITK